jgi:hypothetical protein
MTDSCFHRPATKHIDWISTCSYHLTSLHILDCSEILINVYLHRIILIEKEKKYIEAATIIKVEIISSLIH